MPAPTRQLVGCAGSRSLRGGMISVVRSARVGVLEVIYCGDRRSKFVQHQRACSCPLSQSWVLPSCMEPRCLAWFWGPHNVPDHSILESSYRVLTSTSSVQTMHRASLSPTKEPASVY